MAFKSFGSNTPATSFSVFGLILLIIAVLLSLYAVRTNKILSRWYAILLTVCLVFGILCALIGPGLSILNSRTVIAQVSRSQALKNLETNERVSWLIRLIAFNSSKDPNLGVGDFPRLGPVKPPAQYTQQFTFVADYQELRGYNVMDAVRMTGLQMRAFEHVSAIIFPLEVIKDRLYPANARGLLQVISKVEEINDDPDVTIEKRFDVNKRLGGNETAKDDLNKYEIGTCAWDSYKKFFNQYCELTEDFKKGEFSAKHYIGNIEKDWNPLGFSRIRTEQPADIPASMKICGIHSWNNVVQEYSEAFGARTFLIKNREIDHIPRRYMIDFDEPERQVIPDIWNDAHVVEAKE
jgi:hypothetical protein